MARYSQFLGRAVTVRYRVGEVLLSATGTFSADSGRSIFLEQHVEQRGTRKYFRWEIPYPYIHRIEPEAQAAREGAVADDATGSPPPKAAAAAAGETTGGGASFSSFSNAPTPLD
ncbi:MAG TPA: hypothetical protein VJX72_01175 [Candidatus Acidoferrum sp.]|nr:hypothetical protein [Candidatus Acidoferrum sp.]